MEKVIEKSEQLQQLHDLTDTETNWVVHTKQNQKIVLSADQLHLIRQGLNQAVDADPSIYF
jgi:hypothetical protein|tara:strand:- start:1334 stop:1516 length:183 start_codon:yes stop_codon:yes gene_type:complete